MILRKPYAFLIKNFKKIHLLILFFVVLLTFYTNKMFRFFDNYVSDRKLNYIQDLTSEYISNILFVYILFILIITTIIFILIYKKNKPKMLYVFNFIFYISLIILLIVNYNYLNIIQIEGLDPRIARILRDFNFMAVLSQIYFSVMFFIRTVGFDIKKFNFGEDILELEIEVSDDEEFELTRGFNLDRFNRKYKSILREYYYFYIENKKVIKILFFSIVISLSTFFIIRFRILNKIYQENEYYKINGIEYSILESYYTKNSYDGTQILNTDYTFLIVKLNIKNNSDNNFKFNSENFSVIGENNNYYENKIYYENFIDIGNMYNNNLILTNSNVDYIVIFKLKDEDLKDKYIFKYLDKIEYYKNKLKTDFTKFSIKPKNLDKIEVFEEKVFNNINFNLSFLKNTYINIKSYDINNKFEYEISNQTRYINEFSRNSTLLKINYDFNKDKSINYINNVEDLFSKHVTIEYYKKNKKNNANFKVVTPNNYINNNIYLSISNDIIDSESIFLNFNIRDKKYVIDLR